MKILKRLLFVVVIILNVSILFFPNMIYWLVKGNQFLGDWLNYIYYEMILKDKFKDDPKAKKEYEEYKKYTEGLL